VGTAEPGGQKTDADPQCCCCEDVLPAGQTYPAAQKRTEQYLDSKVRIQDNKPATAVKRAIMVGFGRGESQKDNKTYSSSKSPNWFHCTGPQCQLPHIGESIPLKSTPAPRHRFHHGKSLVWETPTRWGSNILVDKAHCMKHFYNRKTRGEKIIIQAINKFPALLPTLAELNEALHHSKLHT
jgi:hypothetical protein